VSFQAASSSEKRTLAISGSGPESPSESSSPSDSSSSSSSSSFTSFVAGEEFQLLQVQLLLVLLECHHQFLGLNSLKEYRQDDAHLLKSHYILVKRLQQHLAKQLNVKRHEYLLRYVLQY
jgi:hypothetical protein